MDLRSVHPAKLPCRQAAQGQRCNEERLSSLVPPEPVGPAEVPQMHDQSERRKSRIACLSISLRWLKRSITALASDGPYLRESWSLEGLSPPSEPLRETWS